MRHVLIIEDNAMIAMSIESALRDTGATSFDFATTEDEAVASAFARRPDVILSDVTLASGTGPSAVQTIFDGIGRVPVLFVTGTPDDCAGCGPLGLILAKPFDAERLCQAVRTAVSGRDRRAEVGDRRAARSIILRRTG